MKPRDGVAVYAFDKAWLPLQWPFSADDVSLLYELSQLPFTGPFLRKVCPLGNCGHTGVTYKLSAPARFIARDLLCFCRKTYTSLVMIFFY